MPSLTTAQTTTQTTTVLFDLDGTISDSAPGILGSMQVAFAAHQIDWLDPQTARSLLGPPLHVSLPPLVGDHRLESVIAAYRHSYDVQRSLFDTTLYAGMGHVLATLHARGLQLAVATSKPEAMAIEVLTHLGVESWFTVVGGDTLDGRLGSKALVVGDVLQRLGSPSSSSVMMIGDRHHDVDGAAAHGVPCIGALWGYGDLDELQAAGAWAICAQPVDLLSVL